MQGSYFIYTFVTMIKRLLEKDIMQRLGYSPAVAILGARQTGKTTLAKQIALKLKKQSVYIDLENPNDRIMLSDAYHYLDMQRDKLVIIDEVQLIPELFSILRPLIDAHRKNKRFLLLGSTSPVLVKGVSESLAGRVAYTYLNPFNLSELPAKYTQNTHWFRGGFPRALLARSGNICLQWHNDIIASYIERDFALLFGTSFSKSVMHRLWQMLASANSAVWNAQNFSRSLGISAPTVNRYLDFMEGTFLVRKLPAWYINAKKRLVKSPKIYIRDSGILHRLNNIASFDNLCGHIIIGASWEGYVVEQTLQLLSPQLNGYFYRTQDGAECDLLLTTGIKPVACIEIKYSNAPQVSKGFYYCLNELKTKHNFIITPSSDDYSLNKNIHVCSMATFIKKYLPGIN